MMQHFIGYGTDPRTYSRIGTRSFFRFTTTTEHVLVASRESKRPIHGMMVHKEMHLRQFSGDDGYFLMNLKHVCASARLHGSKLWTVVKAGDECHGGSCLYQGLRFRRWMTQVLCTLCSVFIGRPEGCLY